MNPVITEFDPSRYLDSEEVIAEFLSQVMADGDTDELLMAIGQIARSRGLSVVAQETGLGRESLYKVFTPGSKPRFDTVMKVMRALGVRLHAVPI
ncbi:MAG: putative addiction module antidote protein [Magnetococcales bacterium]|nr:putative addiction module antidote protein [Magnetococcales bacterium]